MPTTPPEIEKIIHEFKELFQREDGLIDKYAYVDNPDSPTGQDVIAMPDAIADWLRTTLTTLHQKHQEEVEKVVEAIQNDIYNLSRKHSPLEDNCPPDCELCLGYNTALMDVRNMPSLTPTKSDKQTEV